MTIHTRRGLILGAGALAGCAALPRAAAVPPGPLPAWTKLSTEPFRGKQDDVFMLPSGVGWYGNGTGKLYKTVDGGASWTKVWDKPGVYIRALGFQDENVGYLGNIAGYYPTATDKTSLYLTQDGGMTWTPAPAPKGPELQGVCAIDVLPGRGGGVRVGGRVGGPAILASSRDGGRTWASQDLSDLTKMILDVKFVDARTGFICGASDADSRKSNPVILKTSDGGATWRQVWRGDRLFEITWKTAWPTKRTGYVTIQNYNPDTKVSQRYVAKSVDGGETWAELPVIDSHPFREFGIGFVDENRGWIGGTTTGVETLDGGVTWRPVELGKAVNKIRVLKGRRGLEAYAIGTDLHKWEAAAKA
ncbi:MAG TPA: hypothetical protein VF699_08865 [Caulobacteraceae bacterium]|jgi:photosystem II stability/assembly factor-like uncharacterized protein